jgi:hypothetical protein
MSAGDQTHDDLTVINGIGPAREEWLRKALDVRTYADLAALTTDEIEQKLKADGYIAAPAVIESWVLQAQELSEEVSTTTYPIDEAYVEAVKEANSSGRNGDWKPYAAFMVEFLVHPVEGRQSEKRVAVHQVELGSMETLRSESWQDTEDEQILLWMLEHAGETTQSAEGIEEAGELVPSAKAPVGVQISQIQAFQPPLTEFPKNDNGTSEKFPENIKSSEPFNLGISFSLTGNTAESMAKSGADFRTRAYVTNVTTGSSLDLGEVTTGSLIEGKVDYNTLLSTSTLKPGTYQLWVTVAVQAAYATPDFSKGPLIAVV